MKDQFCTACGAKIKEGVKFCTSCGKSINAKASDSDSKIKHHVSVPIDSPSPVHPAPSEETAKKHGNGGWIAALIVAAVVLIIIFASIFDHSGNTNGTSAKSVNSTSASNNVQASVVGIYCDNDEGGSGTMFTTDGTVLTNNHVITGATSCKVTIPNPTTGGIAEIYEATPVVTPKLSKEYDIATVKITGSYTDASGTTWGSYPTTFTAFTLPSTCNTSTPSQLGDTVKIYGYPITSGELNLTETDGIVSSFAEDGDILTSAKVDSGNSGGLAVDQNGCWLGIPSAVVSGNYQNLGVIIPGSVVENIMSGAPAKYEPAVASSGASALVAAVAASTPQETNDQVCQDNYGSNSQFDGNTASDGTPYCDCKSGYEWDGSGDACATQVSLQQSCQSSYGVGSYAYENGTKAQCGCSTGYQWNSNQSACVAVQETPQQVCQDNYGYNSEYSGQTNNQGGPVCQCQSGYVWNSAQTACVAPPSCTAFSTYNPSTNQCECDSGYIADGDVCESATTYCQDSEGYGANYDADTNTCGCSAGYSYSDGRCEDDYSYCTDLDGAGATYDAGTNSCTCESGYVSSGGRCVSGYTYCEDYGGYGDQYDSATGQCTCEYGYEWNGSSCVYEPNY